jgi:hypothetical protein
MILQAQVKNFKLMAGADLLFKIRLLNLDQTVPANSSFDGYQFLGSVKRSPQHADDDAESASLLMMRTDNVLTASITGDFTVNLRQGRMSWSIIMTNGISTQAIASGTFLVEGIAPSGSISPWIELADAVISRDWVQDFSLDSTTTDALDLSTYHASMLLLNADFTTALVINDSYLTMALQSDGSTKVELMVPSIATEIPIGTYLYVLSIASSTDSLRVASGKVNFVP